MPLQFERMRFAAERLVSSSRSQIETEAAALLRFPSSRSFLIYLD